MSTAITATVVILILLLGFIFGLLFRLAAYRATFAEGKRAAKKKAIDIIREFRTFEGSETENPGNIRAAINRAVFELELELSEKL